MRETTTKADVIKKYAEMDALYQLMQFGLSTMATLNVKLNLEFSADCSECGQYASFLLHCRQQLASSATRLGAFIAVYYNLEQLLNPETAVLNSFYSDNNTVQNIAQILSNNQMSNNKDTWSFNDWSKNDSQGLAEMELNNPQKFNTLIQQLNTEMVNKGLMKKSTTDYQQVVSQGSAPVQSGNQQADRATWSFNDWSKNDSEGLAEMQINNPQKFAQLYSGLTMELKQKGVIR